MHASAAELVTGCYCILAEWTCVLQGLWLWEASSQGSGLGPRLYKDTLLWLRFM